jgi:hypothetical protein
MRGSAVFRTGVAPGGALAGPWVQNSLWTRARAVPSLDLRFADNKSLVDATTGSNLVTFTRASSGTYVGSDGVLRSAVTNAPRFDHNPTTGESLGLLVEEARTNSFAWSNSADGGETWNNVGTSLNLASGQSDPAGGTAGIRATDANSGSGGTSLQRTSLANLTASTTVTYSVWLKPIDCPNNNIRLHVFANTTTDSINAVFSVSGTAITGVSTTVEGTGAASGASFEVFPNGWYRCRLTGVPSTVTMADVRARINLASYQRAIGTARFDWYGAQLESGAFATSYIPTSGTAATRAADVASITGSNFSSWYRQDEGTMFAEFVPRTFAQACGLLSLDNGTTSERLQMRLSTNGKGFYVVVDGGSVQANFGTVASTSLNTKGRLATSFAVNSFKVSLNGGSVASDTSGTLPTVAQAVIGNAVGVFIFNGPISRIAFWPRELPESTLQTITQ